MDTDPEQKHLGIRLKELLVQNGLTAGELARATGLTRQAIYQILSGKTRAPRRGTVDKIAGALNVPAQRLFIGGGDDLPGFMHPDPDILSQIPDTIGPELEAMIQRELPDAAPLRLEGPPGDAYQDILKMKLYLILKKTRLAGDNK